MPEKQREENVEPIKRLKAMLEQDIEAESRTEFDAAANWASKHECTHINNDDEVAQSFFVWFAYNQLAHKI